MMKMVNLVLERIANDKFELIIIIIFINVNNFIVYAVEGSTFTRAQLSSSPSPFFFILSFLSTTKSLVHHPLAR